MRIDEAMTVIRNSTEFVPEVALVLGSGLGAYADGIRAAAQFDYPSVGLSEPGVAGHAGKLVLGTRLGRRVACFCGRTHLYEGRGAQACVAHVRLAKALGARVVVLTNAAGGIAEGLRTGDLMLLRDQICFVPSPLLGPNDNALGPRFPDMTEVYDGALRAALLASPVGPTLKTGVYLQVAGPQYETPAEIRAYRLLGADAIGMSTAIEAIAARHAGLRVIGLSCITNLAAGLNPAPLSHEEVGRIAARAAADVHAVLDAALATA